MMFVAPAALHTGDSLGSSLGGRGVQQRAAHPLVLDLHARGAKGEAVRSYSGFEDLASEEHFVVVWPDALRIQRRELDIEYPEGPMHPRHGGQWNVHASGRICIPRRHHHFPFLRALFAI